MIRGKFRIAALAAMAALIATPSLAAYGRGSDLRTAVLRAHAAARAQYELPPLQWDEGLAMSARGYAEQMARTNVYRHDATPGRRKFQGENLWRGVRGVYDYDTMMGGFLAEQRDFRPGVFPAVARRGDWSGVGHFTQMIWPTTTHVGCAIASNATYDYLVCRYSPPGNKDGRPVGYAAPYATAGGYGANR